MINVDSAVKISLSMMKFEADLFGVIPITSIVQFLIYSLILHALFLALPDYFLNWEEDDPSKAQPIRVRIVHSESVSKDHGEKKPLRMKVAGVRKSGQKRRAPKVGSNEPRNNVGVEVPVGAYAYSDLFPQGQSQAVETSGRVDSRDGTQGASYYDPESDQFSFDDKTRNMARLNGFAREVSERISVPGALKELEPFGKAFLRFSRKEDGWRIVSVNGDPYYRALLYEVMDKLSRNSQAYHLLSETDYDSVRIYFSFRTASSLDQTVKPIETKTDANKVYIDITYQVAGAAWHMAMPQTNERGETKVGLNLVGVGMMAYKAVMNDAPGEDTEARKLRLSPAFARPIGR